jgi:hypothetical protein
LVRPGAAEVKCDTWEEPGKGSFSVVLSFLPGNDFDLVAERRTHRSPVVGNGQAAANSIARHQALAIGRVSGHNRTLQADCSGNRNLFACPERPLNSVGGVAGKLDISSGQQEQVLNITRITGVFIIHYIGIASEINVPFRDNGGLPTRGTAGGTKISFNIKKSVGNIAISSELCSFLVYEI